MCSSDLGLHTAVRRVRLGAPETTRNTWPDIVSQVTVHRIGSPYYTRGGIPSTQKFWEFLSLLGAQFWGFA